jgi:predicted nucleic acid-binding protein
LTVYDSLYLALAEAHGAALYTADERLMKVSEGLNL